MQDQEYQERIEDLECYLCDEYKTINGSKARWFIQSGLTLIQLEMEAAYLSQQIGLLLDEEKVRQAASVVEFEKLLDDTMAMGAGDRETALRWLQDSDDHMYSNDRGYFEYCNDLPYGYMQRTYPQESLRA